MGWGCAQTWGILQKHEGTLEGVPEGRQVCGDTAGLFKDTRNRAKTRGNFAKTLVGLCRDTGNRAWARCECAWL